MLNRALKLLGVLALPAVIAACPGIGDIDRTQPEKVKKSIFFESDGKTPAEFYYRQTIIDVPATNGVTFIGEQGETERVVFEVTEQFLFAHRAYGWLQNDGENGAIDGNQGDGYARPGVPYDGTPVAAFRISSHFDVKRQYNAQTGEQTNVIIEDSSDRPWYEREYIRVDWSTNQIADFRFGSASVLQTPASLSVPQEDTELDAENKDRPKIDPEYIDIVTRLNVEPEAIDLSWYGWGMVPECYFYSSIYKDCLGGTIKVRNSFMRVGERDYMPLKYDDVRFQKFGFFRSERFAYNDEYGVVEPAQVRLANRWNLWKDAASCYDPEADLPYASCEPSQLRTIVYYLNEDFPKDPTELRQTALGNADEWNRVFRQAIMDATGWSEADLGDRRLFTICANNPVKDGDPAECGEPGLNPQIGDLRYSMYYYVPNFQFSPPLGYGPSAADPLTGEIIQGNAFYYGAAGATIAARTRDIIKLQLGILDDEDITGGIPASDAVAAAQSMMNNDSRFRAIENAAEKARVMADNLKIKQTADRLNAQIDSGVAMHDRRPARLEALKATGADEILLTDEIREVFAGHLLEEGMVGSEADATLAARLLDDEALFRREHMRVQRLLTPAARGCILSAEDVFDDALLGLLAKIRNKFYDNTQNPPVLKPGFTEADVYNFMLAQTMGDTQLHEIGHTVGLRHNFSGSTDALNFGPEYWRLKGYTLDGERPAKEWALLGSLRQSMELALEEGLRDNQDSTVMDYASTYGTSNVLGSYDLAAIKYAYGDVVEVFNSTDMTPERAALLRQGELHYTYYPEVVSDAASFDERVAAMYDRGNVNYRKLAQSERVEVPYSFCSDEYRDASATCAIWDQGADNFERTAYMADVYRNYSIFNHFKRERLTFGVDIFSYMARVYTRDFTYILNQYKNWVNDELIIRSDRPCLGVVGGQVTVVDDDRFAADACGLAGFLGTVEAVNLFAEVMETPDVGCYVRLKPGCYDTVAGNLSDSGPPDDADITLVSADPSACDSYSPVVDEENPRGALKISPSSQYMHVRDSTSCEGYTAPGDEALWEEPIELGYERGVSRPANTLYDRDAYGYYFYIKPLVVGSWWDKWLAVKALGDSNTDFIGVDASSDTRSFLISLNTIFGDDINNLIGGAVTDNAATYGPIVNEAHDGVELLPLLSTSSGGAIDRAELFADGRATLNPDQQYTFRLLAMFNAAYNGQYTDQFEFGESLQVGAAFNLTDTDIPQAIINDPNRFAVVTDPVSGQKWYAINQQRSSAEGLYSIGYEFIREIKAKYYVGGAAGPGTTLLPAFQGGMEWMPRGDLNILRIMASTAARFGWSDVWEGDIQF